MPLLDRFDTISLLISTGCMQSLIILSPETMQLIGNSSSCVFYWSDHSIVQMYCSKTIICIRTHSSSMSFLSGSLRFTDGWRNAARAWRHFCGLPDHHGEVFKSYRYNRTGNGEHLSDTSSLGAFQKSLTSCLTFVG